MKTENGSVMKENLVKTAPGFGRWLRRNRVQVLWNQRELGEAVGVSHQHVAAIEAGTANPSPSLKARLKQVIHDKLASTAPAPAREEPPEDAKPAPSFPQDMIPADAVLNALAIIEECSEPTKNALRLLLGKVS